MATATLRPNATTQTAGGSIYGTAGSMHAATSDASDSTGVQISGTATYYGDTTPPTTLPIIQLADATGTVPAGRQIISVNVYARLQRDTGANGFGSSALSIRYSNNRELTSLQPNGTGGGTIEQVSTGAWNSAANRVAGGAPSWTYADVDGLKFVLGSNFGSNQSPGGIVYDIWAVVTYSDLPPTPTAITPASGATVTTGNPTFTGSLAAIATGQKQRIEFQIATNSGFTTGVKNLISPYAQLKASGTYTLDSNTATDDNLNPLAPKLNPGTYYLRARGVDEYGIYGAYSAATTFTVAHAPTTTGQSPTGSTVLPTAATTTLSWTFSDPWSGDTQSAYQIVVERNDTGVQVLDTGKVTSTAKTATVTIGATYKDIPLRWKIQVWDAGGTTAGYSNYHIFKLSDPPTVTIGSPAAAEVIGTGQPTVTWTLDAGSVQAQRRVIIRKSNDALVYDSGMATTTSMTWTAPNTILENNSSYKAQVIVIDTDGLTSATASQSFSTSYPAPATVTFSVDASGYETNGYVNIDWSGMQEDGFFVDWKLYRRLTGSSSWELLTSFTNVNIRSYHDWTATSQNTYEYAVTQEAGRSGAVIEGALVASEPVLADGSHYWLINPYDETDNLRLDHVKGDTFTDGYEEAELNIIGRGRKMNHGTRWGYDGSLTAEFRDNANGTARSKRLRLELLKAARTSYYLRNPFGDLWLIAMGNLQIGRVEGIGTREHVEVTIPYKEVM